MSFEKRKEIFADPVFGSDTRWLSRYLTEDFTPLSDDEEDIILEHDHWTNSQDPEDFKQKVEKDSNTKVVIMKANDVFEYNK